jgi:hypothetical protein
VITKDYGAQTETVEDGVTGRRCHTLADLCEGVTAAVEGKFNREYIRERAVSLYDMFVVAKRYDYALRCINDVYNGSNGWLSATAHSHIFDDARHGPPTAD